MLLFVFMIALCWVLATTAVVGVCLAAAAGDRTEILPGWPDSSLTT
jgi:hypothetical protein